MYNFSRSTGVLKIWFVLWWSFCYKFFNEPGFGNMLCGDDRDPSGWFRLLVFMSLILSSWIVLVILIKPKSKYLLSSSLLDLDKGKIKLIAVANEAVREENEKCNLEVFLGRWTQVQPYRISLNQLLLPSSFHVIWTNLLQVVVAS